MNGNGHGPPDLMIALGVHPTGVNHEPAVFLKIDALPAVLLLPRDARDLSRRLDVHATIAEEMRHATK